MCMKIIRIGFCFLILAATACAGMRSLSITYYSDPPGASLYEDGKYMGQAPLTLRYNLSDAALQNRVTKIKGLTARWVSGAEAYLNLTDVDLNSGLQQSFTFVRPANYPGREMDVDYAVEINRQRAVNQASRAREEQCSRIASAQYSKVVSNPVPGLSGIGLAARALAAKNDAMARCMSGLPIPEVAPPPQRQQQNMRCTTTYLGGQAVTNCNY